MTVETTLQSGAAFRAAEQLAEAIRTMPEWEEWESARAAVRTDAGFQSLAAQHRDMVAGGSSEDGAAEAEVRLRAGLEALRREMEQHPVMLRQQEAVYGLLGLLRGVNQTLSEALGIDFARSAAPREANCSSGCCG